MNRKQKKGKRRKNITTRTKRQIQKKFDERRPCHVIINGKNAIYFLFLKRFKDIPFGKTICCRSF